MSACVFFACRERVASAEGPVAATQIGSHGRVYTGASSSPDVGSDRSVITIVSRLSYVSGRSSDIKMLGAQILKLFSI